MTHKRAAKGALKKAVIPDYALKSSLHPCDGLKELHISLVRGDRVREEKFRSLETKNGLSLHLLMILLNLIYFAFVARWDSRRRQRNDLRRLELANL